MLFSDKNTDLKLRSKRIFTADFRRPWSTFSFGIRKLNFNILQKHCVCFIFFENNAILLVYFTELHFNFDQNMLSSLAKFPRERSDFQRSFDLIDDFLVRMQLKVIFSKRLKKMFHLMEKRHLFLDCEKWE